MRTITTHSTRSRRRRDFHSGRASLPTPVHAPQPAAPVNPHNRGGWVAFEVRFSSAMCGADLELLRRQLGMTTHVDHKLPVDPNSPGVAQLDQDSSLLLEHGASEGEWVLQARTWGEPSARTVRAWRVRVVQVARQLDPEIVLPEGSPVEPSRAPLRPVGRATNRRLSAVRRRLTGLS